MIGGATLVNIHLAQDALRQSARGTTNMSFGDSQNGFAKIAANFAKEAAEGSQRSNCAMRRMAIGASTACTRSVQNAVQRHDRKTASTPFGT